MNGINFIVISLNPTKVKIFLRLFPLLSFGAMAWITFCFYWLTAVHYICV
uniref:Uncharacterized protein n=1 Tax=Anguilla anguilla TaxID=7936 RepID=A0A0E9SEC4_ANGAN